MRVVMSAFKFQLPARAREGPLVSPSRLLCIPLSLPLALSHTHTRLQVCHDKNHLLRDTEALRCRAKRQQLNEQGGNNLTSKAATT